MQTKENTNGSKTGIGAVMASPGIETIMKFTFRASHFDVRNVKHEDFYDTVKNLKGRNT